MKKLLWLFLLTGLALNGCKSKSGSSDENVTPAEGDKNVITCIWDGVPVKAEPNKEGKWISSISLAEKLNYLDETKVDSSDNNNEYYKVKLSDGKTGWARSYGLILNSHPAAVIEKITVCKRPDMLTQSGKDLNPMDIVAVKQVKDDWIEVVGEKKKITGWIKADKVTSNNEDVATAVFIVKELAKKDSLNKMDKITSILDKVPYQNSIFVSQLHTLLDELGNNEGEYNDMEEEIADTTNYE